MVSMRNVIQDHHVLEQSTRLTLEVLLPLPYQIRNRIFKCNVTVHLGTMLLSCVFRE